MATEKKEIGYIVGDNEYMTVELLSHTMVFIPGVGPSVPAPNSVCPVSLLIEAGYREVREMPARGKWERFF